MSQRAMVKPTNKIVLDSGNLHIQTMKVEVATNMYAGRLVKRGTGDDDAVVFDTGTSAIGWLGYEQTTKKHRPATVTTIYSVGAQAAVLSGPGIVLLGKLKSGNNVSKGAFLVGTIQGMLAAGTTGPVAKAEESVDATSEVKDILVRSLI